MHNAKLKDIPAFKESHWRTGNLNLIFKRSVSCQSPKPKSRGRWSEIHWLNFSTQICPLLLLMFVEFMSLWFEKGIPLFSLELEFFILMLTSTDLHSEQCLSKRFSLGDQWDNYFKLTSVMKNDSPVNLWMFLNLKATEMHFHSNAKCKGKCLQSCI